MLTVSLASVVERFCLLLGVQIKLFLGGKSVRAMLDAQLGFRMSVWGGVCVAHLCRTKMAVSHLEIPWGHFYVFLPCLEWGTILGGSPQ